MKLLAIETTELRGTLAAMEQGTLLLERELCSGDQRSAQSLVPAIALLVGELGWSINELNLIAVAKGPGSFTGLRVGITTAKVLAYALGIPVVGVNTLEAMARGLLEVAFNRTVSVALDAQRGDVAAQHFFVGQKITPLDNSFKVLPVREWLGLNHSLDDSKQMVEHQKTLFCSPVLDHWESKVPLDLLEQFVPQSFRSPRARWVAEVAWHNNDLAKRDDTWSLLPIYSRKSAAEERALVLQHGQ